MILKLKSVDKNGLKKGLHIDISEMSVLIEWLLLWAFNVFNVVISIIVMGIVLFHFIYS